MGERAPEVTVAVVIAASLALFFLATDLLPSWAEVSGEWALWIVAVGGATVVSKRVWGVLAKMLELHSVVMYELQPNDVPRRSLRDSVDEIMADLDTAKQLVPNVESLSTEVKKLSDRFAVLEGDFANHASQGRDHMQDSRRHMD